jgi:hypothetical protein
MKIKVGQLKTLIREAHEVVLKEFMGKHVEDEFLIGLFAKFPFDPNFDVADGEKYVQSALKRFGSQAMNFVTQPKVWLEKIQAHNAEMSGPDAVKLTKLILKAIGA